MHKFAINSKVNMLIVIDGYNLLRQYESSPDEAKRKAFIKNCIKYAKAKRHALLIVFDAGPFIWPYKEKASKLVTVVWVGMKESADDYIKQLLQEGKKINLLVSSDNELKRSARQAQVETMNSQEFLHFFFEKDSLVHVTEQSPLKKLTETSHPELDSLMEQAAQDVTRLKAEDFTPLNKKMKTEKLSKEERAKERTRKKL